MVEMLVKKIYRVFQEEGIYGVFNRTVKQIKKRINPSVHSKTSLTMEDLFLRMFPEISPPISSVNSPSSSMRLNLVVDTINHDVLFGGVATSLILAVLYAHRRKIPLRIISTKRTIDVKVVNEFIALHRLPVVKLEFVSVCFDGLTITRKSLDVYKQDIFISTSWWSTFEIKSINRNRVVFYLLQEDESMFYAHSDRHILFEKALLQDQVQLLVNSKSLFSYLADQKSEKIKGKLAKGIYFEPAFPDFLYSKSIKKEEGQKKVLFFYARPNHPRNLFYTGVELLDRALCLGVLDPNKWEIVFAGCNDVPDFSFSNGLKPKFYGKLGWNDYINLLKKTDLAVNLMYTPHSSYPPLEACVCGCIAFTNNYSKKREFIDNKNIIFCDLQSDKIIDQFSDAIDLVLNLKKTDDLYHNHSFPTSWESTLTPVFDFMDRYTNG